MELVIVRHGESVANFENYWTGWLDVPLTEKGKAQAFAAGQAIAEQEILFDQAFSSLLYRSVKTCQLVLEACDQLYVPETKTWRLNERHYGALVGKNKEEMAAEFGPEQVLKWRRGFYEEVPLMTENHFDRRYDHLDPRLIPKGERLADTYARVMPLWQDELAPRLLDGQNLLVTGHGNSLRALVKFLENVPDEQMEDIEIPNAEPVLYRFNEQLQVVNKEIL